MNFSVARSSFLFVSMVNRLSPYKMNLNKLHLKETTNHLELCCSKGLLPYLLQYTQFNSKIQISALGMFKLFLTVISYSETLQGPFIAGIFHFTYVLRLLQLQGQCCMISYILWGVAGFLQVYFQFQYKGLSCSLDLDFETLTNRFRNLFLVYINSLCCRQY